MREAYLERLAVLKNVWSGAEVGRESDEVKERVRLERSLGNLVQGLVYGQEAKIIARRRLAKDERVKVRAGGEVNLVDLERDGVKVAAELVTPDGEYKWQVFDEAETGMMMVGLEDLKTGVMITTQLAKPEARTAAWKAWSGARQSRSSHSAVRIGHELVEQVADTDKKAGAITAGEYGHASVADMARLSIDIGGAPMEFYFRMFNLSSVNSGQEKSTRFQKGFSRSALPNLEVFVGRAGVDEGEWVAMERSYHETAQQSLELFNKWRERLSGEFARFYNVDVTDKDQKSALDARVLDTARRFLLMGFGSGMNFETSARDMARIIGILRGSGSNLEVRMANQLERLLAPSEDEEKKLAFLAEAPTLIRHTESYTLVKRNLRQIEMYLREETDLLEKVKPGHLRVESAKPKADYIGSEYSAAQKMAAQYILSIWPELEFREVLGWLDKLDEVSAERLGKLVFADHNNRRQMLSQAETTENTKIVEASAAVVRDLNRHRAQGRFVPFLAAERGVLEMMGRGFVTPQYLADIPEFAHLREEFDEDMKSLFSKTSSFIGKALFATEGELNWEVVKQLVPLALNMELVLHGNPRQDDYLENQRVLPGGDFEYTWIAWWLNQLEANSEPLLRGMKITGRPDLEEMGIKLEEEPEADERARFLSRK